MSLHIVVSGISKLQLINGFKLNRIPLVEKKDSPIVMHSPGSSGATSLAILIFSSVHPEKRHSYTKELPSNVPAPC